MSNFGDFDPDKIGQKFKRTKINYVKKDESNVYRVLPPFGKLQAQNKIAQYWTIHYGFVKSKTGKNIPVPCGQASKFENGKKVITQSCPLCDRAAAMENAVSTLRAQNNPANQSALLALEKKIETLSVDKKYYLNVLTREGAVEILKIGHKQMLLLESETKRLKKEFGFNAAGIVGGLFMDFRKSGVGRDSTFQVVPSTVTTRDPATGAVSGQYITSDLTADDLGRISKEAKELTELFRTFTNEDLALIAKGDETTIARLFSNPVNEVEEDGGDDETAATDAATLEALKMAGIATGAQAQATPAHQVTVATPVATPVAAPAAKPAATGGFGPAATDTVGNQAQLAGSKELNTPATAGRALTSDEIINSFLKG